MTVFSLITQRILQSQTIQESMVPNMKDWFLYAKSFNIGEHGACNQKERLAPLSEVLQGDPGVRVNIYMRGVFEEGGLLAVRVEVDLQKWSVEE